MALNGFIKIHKKITEWGWYKDANTARVFLHILIKTNFKDGEYMGVPIKAGQCVIGRKAFAEQLGISEQNVRTALKHLLKSGEISTNKVTNRFTVYNVEMWRFYQLESVAPNQQTNQHLTNSQPQMNKEKKDNNNKPYGKYIPEPPKYERFEAEEWENIKPMGLPDDIREQINAKYRNGQGL